MSGGEIAGQVRLNRDSILNLEGGLIRAPLGILANTTVIMSGGQITTNEYARLTVANAGTLEIRGRNFLLDGVPIPNLNAAGDSVLLPNRDGILEATLKDGTSFSLWINGGPGFPPTPPNHTTPTSRIADNAILRLVMVPEPGAATLSAIGILVLTHFRRANLVLPAKLR